MSIYLEDQEIKRIAYYTGSEIVAVKNVYVTEPYSETCLYFDGVDDYLQATETSKLNFTSPIILEFKYESETYSPYLISKTATFINQDNEWGIIGNTYILHLRAGGVTYNTLSFPANINQRYRIKIQIEGLDVVYYVDGVEIGRYVNPNIPGTNSAPFRVGYNFTSNPLHGRLYYLQVGSEIFNINEGSGSTTTGSLGTVLTISGASWQTEDLPVTKIYSYATEGQEEFTTPGSYSFQVPLGVTSVSAVAVGGGGSGGGGGGLGWVADYPVTPGQLIDVVVGAGGNSSGDGGDSYFDSISDCAGLGGKGASNGSAGGSFAGDGGGNGGYGAAGSSTYGGGGAGGYAGNGGNGAVLANGSSGSGGGGGGGRSDFTNDGGGGGVGIYGQGSNGAGGGATDRGGIGGSGGTKGGSNNLDGNANGGQFGGGGGGRSGGAGGIGAGSSGAVRIIWGENRAYPSTNTQDI